VRIIFIRHAESIKNIEKRHGKAASGFGLTTQGIESSISLAKKLVTNGVRIDKIYASDSTQAIETANILSTYLGINFTCLENFQSLDYGIVCGFSTDEISRLYPNVQSQIDLFNANKLHPKEFNIPDMESAISFDQRISRALESILEKSNNDSTLAVITHTSIINFLINSVVSFPNSLIDSNFKRYNLANLSFTTIIIDKGTHYLENIEININPDLYLTLGL
jgi:broad specificity phosphatase PhoE